MAVYTTGFTTSQKTGGEDVTAALQSFFDSVPDGTVGAPNIARLDASATYLADNVIFLEDRNYIEIDGQSAKLTNAAADGGTDGTLQTPPSQPGMSHEWPRKRGQLYIWGGRGITVHDLDFTGNNPFNGLDQSAYVEDYEAQHCLELMGVKECVVYNVDCDHPRGDWILMGPSPNDGEDPDDVEIYNFNGNHNGRMGIAITSGSNIHIHDITMDNNRRACIDFEPNSDDDLIDGVTIEDSTFGAGRLTWVSNGASKGKVKNVTFDNISLTGGTSRVAWGSDLCGMHENVSFNAVVATAADDTSLPAFGFKRTKGVTVTGCTLIGTNRTGLEPVSFTDCTGITESGNTFTNWHDPNPSYDNTQTTPSTTPGGNEATILNSAEAWWVVKQRNGSNEPQDQSGNAHHMVNSGGGADPTLLTYDSADDGYAWIPTTANAQVRADYTSQLDISGDLDLRVHVCPDDWTPASDTMLFAIWAAFAAGKSYRFLLRSDGKPEFQWQGGSTVTCSAATGFTDATKHWVRVTLDVDNGASGYDLKFWTSSDGFSWNQLGTTTTGGSTTSITNASSTSASHRIGKEDASTAGGTNLKVYEVQVRDGIDGTLKANPTFQATPSPASSMTDNQGTEWTLIHASTGYPTVWVDQDVLVFDGTDDELLAADHANLDFEDAQAFTACFFGRLYETPSDGEYFFGKGSSGAGWRFGFPADGAEDGGVELNDGTSSMELIDFDPEIGNDYFFAITYDGSVAKLYADGIYEDTDELDLGSMANSSGAGVLAGFRGCFMGAAIYRSELTLPQILDIQTALQNYNLGLEAPSMATAYDDVSTDTDTSPGSASMTALTLPSGTGRTVVVIAAYEGGSQVTLDDIVFDPGGGDEITFGSWTKVMDHSDSVQYITMWYADVPNGVSAGDYTVTCDYATGSSGAATAYTASAISGVATGGPEATATASNGGGSDIDAADGATITTVTNGAIVLDAISSGDTSNFTADDGQTKEIELDSGSSTLIVGSKVVATAGASNQGWTLSGTVSRMPWIAAAWAPEGTSQSPVPLILAQLHA